jgi:hypothetical protein
MTAQLALLAPTSQVTTSIGEKFEEFWKIMPSRAPHANPKRPALQKFTTLVRRNHVDPDAILDGARAYAATRAGSEPQFNVMAVTFLNQWRFGDDYTQPTNGGTGPGGPTCGSSYADLARKLAGHGDQSR